MTKKEEQRVNKLIEECKVYRPLDGRIFVYPLKIKQIKQADYSFDLNEESKRNEGKDPAKHRVDLKKIQPMINARYQKAVVLAIPTDEFRFKPGDEIVYPIGCLNPLDLIQGVSILRKYDVAAAINESGEMADYYQTLKYATSYSGEIGGDFNDYIAK